MTSIQKIIKYFAIALAVTIILAIATSLSFGFYVLGNVTGAIKENQYVTDNMETISKEVTDNITALEVELSTARLEIKQGDSFKVDTNKSNISYENENGKIIVKEQGNHFLNFGRTGTLTIYFPKSEEMLNTAIIKTGAGAVFIDNIKTKNLELKLGAGATEIKNIVTTNSTSIDGGTGKIKIDSSELSNLDLDLGIGKTELEAKLIYNSNINSGIGGVDITLIGSDADYLIKAEKGIGDIKINGTSIEDNQTNGSGQNRVNVQGGIGSINIDFKE